MKRIGTKRGRIKKRLRSRRTWEEEKVERSGDVQGEKGKMRGKNGEDGKRRGIYRMKRIGRRRNGWGKERWTRRSGKREESETGKRRGFIEEEDTKKEMMG